MKNKGGRPAIYGDGKPTPETIARRAILAGAGGDQAMTSTLTDLLFTREIISEQQWRAACRYSYCRRMLYGATVVSAVSKRWEGIATGGHEVGDRAIGRARDEHSAMAEAMGELRHQVESVVVFDTCPHWLKFELGLVAHQRPGDARQRARFVDGVDRLTLAYEGLRAARTRDAA